MSAVKTFVAAVLAALAVPAQERGWTLVDVPGAGGVAFAVSWDHGFDDDAPDECGAARVLAECRLERARAAVPGVRGSGVHVVGDVSIAFVLTAVTEQDAGVRFCAALLDDSLPVADDAVALAIARAALQADDADWLYPGLVLRGRAQRALLVGPGARGAAGSPAALQALTPQRVRELLGAPVGVAAVAVGALDDAGRAADARAPLRTMPTPPPPGGLVEAPPRDVAFAPHPRVRGPFVAAAFAVQSDADLAALAVAVDVARTRAVRLLRLRGGESMARAPIVAWSWLDGDALVMFCRRAVDGDEPSAARADLERLLADLRERAPEPAEIAASQLTLQHELGLTPLPAETADGALPGRAIALLLGAARGVRAADVTAVTGESAHRALQYVCAPERAWWGGLVPVGAANATAPASR